MENKTKDTTHIQLTIYDFISDNEITIKNKDNREKVAEMKIDLK